MQLDSEQKAALDYGGSCVIIGPPGAGKTEVFNAKADVCPKPAAFLPFTRAARQELKDRISPNGITISTIDSFCFRQLGHWTGSHESVLRDFLKEGPDFRYQLVGVDEVQDLRPLHFEVIKALLDGPIFAGGDPYQTIYTFGDAMGYKVFTLLQELGCKEFLLHNDYRSGTKVVKLLNHIYPRDIVAKGPKTFGRDAIFTRTHAELDQVSSLLEDRDIPHHQRLRGGKERLVLGGGSLYLMVVHACKGLGFDRVFQVDWSNLSGGLPEKNLLYVSVARASKEFYLVSANYGRGICESILAGTSHNSIGPIEMVRLCDGHS